MTDSQNLSPDVYVALTLAAAATQRLRLGPGVTNPVTRHAAAAASAITAIHAHSGGRAMFGIGRGDSSLFNMEYVSGDGSVHPKAEVFGGFHAGTLRLERQEPSAESARIYADTASSVTERIQ